MGTLMEMRFIDRNSMILHMNHLAHTKKYSSLCEPVIKVVLSSIVEGRALVMQEAMSQGMALLVTANTGGEDLVIEGKRGFCLSRKPDIYRGENPLVRRP